MKKNILIILICIIITLHWYNSTTERMIPKVTIKEKIKTTQQKKNILKKKLNLK